MPRQSQARRAPISFLWAGLLAALLLAAPSLHAQGTDDDFWDDKPKKAKTVKVKPSKLPRLHLDLNRTAWDGRSSIPADVPLKFSVLPPDLDPPAGATYRMASASLYYTDPGAANGYTEVGKPQSSRPGQALLYLLDAEVIQKLYDKKNTKARIIFSVQKVLRVLPDGTEQEEELKGKQLFLTIPIARD
jgi:hypothetical protein